MHEAVGAFFSVPKFHKRFCMSPRLFEMLYHDITNPITRYPEFHKGPDAAGNFGASTLQKLVNVMRQLAHRNIADIVEEYIGVHENSGRLMLLHYWIRLDVFYGPTNLGAWTEEAIKKGMDINSGRGFTGMLGSIDCTHWVWKNWPMPRAKQFRDRSGIRPVIAKAVAGSNMYF